MILSPIEYTLLHNGSGSTIGIEILLYGDGKFFICLGVILASTSVYNKSEKWMYTYLMKVLMTVKQKEIFYPVLFLNE